MSNKKQIIGKISGKVIMTSASGKLNRNDGAVKSGTGYHKSVKEYNRKSKENQLVASYYFTLFLHAYKIISGQL